MIKKTGKQVEGGSVDSIPLLAKMSVDCSDSRRERRVYTTASFGECLPQQVTVAPK